MSEHNAVVEEEVVVLIVARVAIAGAPPFSMGAQKKKLEEVSHRQLIYLCIRSPNVCCTPSPARSMCSENVYICPKLYCIF